MLKYVCRCEYVHLTEHGRSMSRWHHIKRSVTSCRVRTRVPTVVADTDVRLVSNTIVTIDVHKKAIAQKKKPVYDSLGNASHTFRADSRRTCGRLTAIGTARGAARERVALRGVRLCASTLAIAGTGTTFGNTISSLPPLPYCIRSNNSYPALDFH